MADTPLTWGDFYERPNPGGAPPKFPPPEVQVPEQEQVPQSEPAPAAGGEEPVLRRGSKGEAVRRLQERLQALGLYRGPIDGDFGPATHAAVRAFQARVDLVQDGIVGPRTWQALRAAAPGPAEPPYHTGPTPSGQPPPGTMAPGGGPDVATPPPATPPATTADQAAPAAPGISPTALALLLGGGAVVAVSLLILLLRSKKTKEVS